MKKQASINKAVPTVNRGFIPGAMYKSPNGQIWNFLGKGRPPVWMLEHFRSGGKAEDLRVK